jgi:hypothetical protein
MQTTNSKQRIFGKYIGEREFNDEERNKALEEFKSSIENRIIYRLFSHTNYCCESKLNAR